MNGQRMRELRKAAGLRQIEVAIELGLDNQTVCNWENRNTELLKVYGESLENLVKDVERMYQIKIHRKAKKWGLLRYE
jgi:transcriptional regulator with XRE-family HTH domain